jgi:hypothetical protein
MAFLTWLVDGLRRLAGLVLPFFARAGDFRRLGPKLWWLVHILVVVAVLGVLAYLNLGPLRHVLQRLVNAAPPIPLIWFPLLGLIIYILFWLLWWLLKLLEPEEEYSRFPDIDTAWEEARGALNEAGIDLTKWPMFLLLGRPAAGEETLFQAAQFTLLVKYAPSRANAPLHVWATREAIYVTCTGASLLGRQATIFAEETEDLSNGSGGPPAPPEPSTFALDRSIGGSIGLGEMPQEVKRLQLLLNKKKDGTLSEEERQELDRLSAPGGGRAAPGRRPRPLLLKNLEQVQEDTDRLEHLCRLLVRSRKPDSGVDGLLVLVPFAATDTEADATQTGEICQRDLAAARRGLGVHCPRLVMFCDLEKVPGFTEFITHFPKDERVQKRLGQRFPLLPDLDEEQIPGMIQGGMSWVCHMLFPSLIYKFLRLEGQEPDEITKEMRGNYQLIQLMSQMRKRAPQLGRILVRGLATAQEGPSLFGGGYLAATGRDADREQAFVAGVLNRLIQEQTYVSWTEETLAEDATYQRWAFYGILGLAAFVLGQLLLIGLLWWKP